MADLTITASRVALVKGGDEHQETAPAAAALTAGSLCYFDTNGKWALVDADTAAHVAAVVGVALNDVETANETLTCAIKGAQVDLGDAIDALAFGAAVYASNTAGALGDAAGTTSLVVGRVVPGWGGTTADKLLQLV
jgi:hypothetical protein